MFWVTSVIGFVAGAALFGAITFLPIYLQIAKGASPTSSGLQLIPMTAGIVVASNIAGRYMGRTGRYRWLTIIGTVLLTAGMLVLSTLTATTPGWRFGLNLVLVGAGIGCIFPVMITAIQNAVPRESLGTATAAGLMFRQIGGSLAVALFGALFASGMAASLGVVPGAGSGLEIGPQMLQGRPQAMRGAVTAGVVHALQPIYLIAAAVGAVGFLFALILQEIPLTNRMVPRQK